MGALVDMVGQQMGRLTVVERHGRNERGRTTWRCLCSCGAITIVLGVRLRSGGTKSCGCLNRETARAMGRARVTHGHMAGAGGASRTYRTWKSMRSRCQDPGNHAFPHYGGRGIEVCERWRKFANFLADMGERPQGMSLERKDNDGNYEPANCKWATRSEQGRNKRSNHVLVVDGVARCLAEWAEITGITREAIYFRLRSGWTPERAISTPVRRRAKRKTAAADARQ